jgi:septum formation protein
MTLILASASPRRRELLTQAGISFQVHPANIPEDPNPGEDPIAYVIRLAREKAEVVFAELLRCPEGHSEKSAEQDAGPSTWPGAESAPDSAQHDSIDIVTNEGASAQATTLVVLGADTAVTIDGQILGKPEDAADAARMLRLLSGRTHRVITGIAVVRSQIPGAASFDRGRTGSGAFIRSEVAAEVTAVKFLTLSEQEIADYIATGEPMDKAGAYAIQGRAARWIPRIEGDYFNVVGLPLALVSTLLESF